MSQSRLSFGEFLIDIKSAITSPARRFAVIKERGALWGSLLLLSISGYFAFNFMSGIYFKKDPFPGYSFILPAIVAVGFSLLKVYPIHFWARLIEGKGRYSRASGTFRNLLGIYGYTVVPALLALLLSFIVFLLIPEQLRILLRDFRTLTICILMALGLSLFIWSLILVVLAMRVVYVLRDMKILLSWLLGTVVLVLPALALATVEQSARIDLIYVRPLLADRLLGFFTVDPTKSITGQTEINVPIDLLAYRFRSPERFDVVSFAPGEPHGEAQPSGEPHRVVGSSSILNLGRQQMGRIVAKPGDNVELVGGRLVLNGRFWEEPYIAPEFRCDASVPAMHLGSSDYLILPEDRRLIESNRNDLVISRDRVTGRVIIDKWPFGWWYHRSTAFLAPVPEDVPR